VRKEDVMNGEWVDFKKIKAAVDMQMVINHYGVKGLRKSGDELRGTCPIHKGSERGKNFTVNLHKNAFKCFSQGCGAHGNVLDFVAAMEECSVRDAGLKIQTWFKIGESDSPSESQPEDASEAIEVSRGIYSGPDEAPFEVLSAAKSAEDFEDLVVYRELFGNYQVWVAPAENFYGSDALFTLVKAL
jgi:hypothetical protein